MHTTISYTTSFYEKWVSWEKGNRSSATVSFRPEYIRGLGKANTDTVTALPSISSAMV